MKNRNKLQKLIRTPGRAIMLGLYKIPMIDSRINDTLFLKVIYFFCFWRRLNLKNPTTFSEKLQWLKLYDRNPRYSEFVDKYAVKKIVADQIGEEYIIPNLGVWDSFEDIDFNELPSQFVLKTTHDSGGVVVCKNKKTFDVKQARIKLEKSMKRNYFYLSREWPYKNVRPRIIAEKYIEDSDGQARDYKWFCFNGTPKMLFIASDRATDTRFDFFDEDFTHLPFVNGYVHADYEIPKPKNFELMKQLASKLSAGFPELRVDFYNIDGKVYFGEMTFYHFSGLVPYEPREWDEKIGSWLDLSMLQKTK